MKKIKQIWSKIKQLFGVLVPVKYSSPARGEELNNDISYKYNKDETILTIIDKNDEINYRFVIGKEYEFDCMKCHCRNYGICHIIKCSSDERIDKQDGYYLKND